MARPTRDWWNWVAIEIPYNRDKYSDSVKAEHFLRDNIYNEKDYQITVETDYPQPRRRWANKVITKHRYHIKDPAIATMFSLKFA